LKTFADREIEQEKVVSQYKASIEKLREAVTAVRGKLKELQSNKEAEKEYYENKVSWKILFILKIHSFKKFNKPEISF